MATDVAAAWESVADIRRRALKHQLVTFQVSVFVFHMFVGELYVSSCTSFVLFDVVPK